MTEHIDREDWDDSNITKEVMEDFKRFRDVFIIITIITLIATILFILYVGGEILW
jgi:hypothetical protein